LVPFDPRRIADAIFRAAQAVGGEDRFVAEELAGVVGLYLERTHGGRIPGVEDVQDAVERVLAESGHAKAAKAFSLHRARRSAAQGSVRVTGPDEPGGLPLVGSDASDAAARWSKARIASALVSEARLDADEADEVARAVEGRVLASGWPRIPSSLVRALVDAELFARGRVRSRERQRLVGVPKHDLLARLEADAGGRVGEPGALAEAVGEELLRQVSLEDLLPRAVAEAHRTGEIHVHDLGCPLRLSSIAPSTLGVVARHLRGEGVRREAGARRLASALGEAAQRYAPFSARAFALEDVNVHLAPFVARLDEDALRVEATELLLSPGFSAVSRRGGLLSLEIGLAAEVPDRLRARPVPAPAPPGRTYGDYADEALRAARAVLSVALELRRAGAGDRLPALTLVVGPGPRDAASRALVREALAAAAETGEPAIVVDRPGRPSRGTRWHRLRADEAPDPLRFDSGDASAASTTSVNLAGAALRAGPGRVDVFLAEVDRLTDLALEAAAARSTFLRRRGEHPDGALYALERGDVPLVDVEGAAHLVDVVGADRAASILEPAASGPDRAALAARAAARVALRIGTASGGSDLRAVAVEGVSAEAAARLAEMDAARFSPVGPLDEGEAEATPTYLPRSRDQAGTFREGVRPRPGGRPGDVRVRHRIRSDDRPSLDALLEAFERAASDAAVVEYVLDPWPRRVVRPG
jgi:ribonucleoside-triphosphate reductase